MVVSLFRCVEDFLALEAGEAVGLGPDALLAGQYVQRHRFERAEGCAATGAGADGLPLDIFQPCLRPGRVPASEVIAQLLGSLLQDLVQTGVDDWPRGNVVVLDDVVPQRQRRFEVVGTDETGGAGGRVGGRRRGAGGLSVGLGRRGGLGEQLEAARQSWPASRRLLVVLGGVRCIGLARQWSFSGQARRRTFITAARRAVIGLPVARGAGPLRGPTCVDRGPRGVPWPQR